MKLGIIAVTEKGVSKALKIKKSIKENYVCDIFTTEKFLREGIFLIEGKLQNFYGFLLNMKKYDTFLFITAAGIAVRTIAPFIKTKDIDPAVVSMDEEGNFIVSLLSGHLGGANKAAEVLGKIIGAVPVISTASDVSGKTAVDTIAVKIQGKLESLESAKKVTSLIVAGKNVELKIPENINSENPQGVIVISNKKNIEISKIIPQNIVVGIGCRKGKESCEIISAVKDAFEKYNLCEESIRIFATVDIKSDEQGILKTAEFFKKDLAVIARDEIKKIEKNFQQSDFVKKNLGVGAVSAPCAFLGSGRAGKFLAEKLKYEGITISIFEERTEKVNG